MQSDSFSAMAALRALRDQVQARLEQNEDFRVLKGLEFVITKETRLPPAQGVQAYPQRGARAAQDSLASGDGTSAVFPEARAAS